MRTDLMLARRPGEQVKLFWPCPLVALAAVFVLVATGPRLAIAASLGDTIERVQPKMVKIHGAGGYRGLEAYQTGFLISGEGHLVTVWSYVLDSDYVSTTLADGRKFEAKLVGADPQIEIAVLKIEAENLPHFDLTQAATAGEGTRVLAFSNLFGVATGDEQVSVLHGMISATTNLAARRGVFQTPYQGPVYVVDAMTNNPGAAGGVLTDNSGRLLGLLGKELRNSRTNTWLNYAIPVSAFSASVEAIRAGKATASAAQAPKKAERPIKLADLGIVLVPNVLDRTPPFVDEVRAGSPAEKAGIRPDDLVLFVGEQIVQHSGAVYSELDHIERDDEVRLTLMRGEELIQAVLKSEPSAE